MIVVRANQYSNLKKNDAIKNKICSINTTLNDTVVTTRTVEEITKSFSEPDTAQYYKEQSKIHEYNPNTTYPRYKSRVRGECRYVSIDQYVESNDPINYTGVKITLVLNTQRSNFKRGLTTDKNNSWYEYNRGDTEYIWDPVGDVSGNETIYKGIESKLTPIGTVDKTETIVVTSLSELKSKLPPIGTLMDPYFKVLNASGSVVEYSDVTNPWADPTHYQQINVTQITPYKVRVTGNIPWYSSGAKAFYDYPDMRAMHAQYYRWLLQSIKIEVLAQTTTTIKQDISTSDLLPALEIPNNELLQQNIQVEGTPWLDWILTVINRNKDGRALIEFDVPNEKLALNINDKVQIYDLYGEAIKNGQMFEIYDINYDVQNNYMKRHIKLVEVK